MFVLSIAVELVTTLITLAGLAYLLIALLAARSFRRAPQPARVGIAPTVSILKPVKGADPQRYAAFVSNCSQIYSGRFELLLGLSEPDDAALLADVERLQSQFPQLAIRAVPCPLRLGTNGKVSTLVQMLPHALGDVLVLNDADIAVQPDYLERITAALSQPGVGLVTAPYYAATGHAPNVWTRLEALGISTEFMPGVLTSRMMERGVHFALGSTLALRRDTLSAIGGMQQLLDQLADDYELGLRVDRSGLRITLSPTIVQTSVPAYTLHQFWQHQLRWSRTVRDARLFAYIGLCTTYALPWALLNVIASGFALPSFTLLSLVVLARVALALSVGVGVLRDGQVLRDLFLLPVRDCFSMLLWAWSFAGNDIVWRGETYRLHRGRLIAKA